MNQWAWWCAYRSMQNTNHTEGAHPACEVCKRAAYRLLKYYESNLS